MIAGFIYLERALLQCEMTVLAHRLSQTSSLDELAGLLTRMAAVQERLLVSSQHSGWPTGFDMAAKMSARKGAA